jgi:small neutral amino acid transporter SnatA (MarC family)
MERDFFVFTIFFMLLGPTKIIPGFLKVTRGADRRTKRKLALQATLIASALVTLVVLLGERMVTQYRISLDGVRLAGGLVLLISALKALFPSAEPSSPESPPPSTLEMALSPVAMPLIVPPAGIAAILIFIMIAPQYPGMEWAIPRALVTMMALNLVVMLFIDTIVRVPGLMLALRVLGGMLGFIQVALGTELLMAAFRSLGGLH